MPSKLLPIRGCAFCLRAFRPVRHWQQFCGPSCRRAAGKEATKAEYVCAYCGMLGGTVDHIPPISIRPTLVALGLDARYPFVVVRSCFECNTALGDRAFWTVEQRREYIAKWIARRYKKYIEIPEWTSKELAALEYSLREMTLHGLAVKALTLRRLANALGENTPSVLLSESNEPRSKQEVPTTFCKTCDMPTQEDEFCSNICEYIATGLNAWMVGKTRRDRWRIVKRMLKKLSYKRRRQLKINRLEFISGERH